MKNSSGSLTRALVPLGVLIASAGCSPIDIANALTPRWGYDVQEDIAYGNNSRQKLDIYTPQDIRPNSPAVLFFYGGRWQFGDKDDYLFVGQALASRGYVTAIADYRLYPEVRWQSMVEDAGDALAKTLELLDERPVVLSGHSAGGYLAAMSALNDELQDRKGIEKCRISAMVGLAGPYDFLPLVQEDIIAVFGPGEAGAETQPITFVTPDDPPALLIHGTDDDSVAIKNSNNLAKAMREAGIEAEAKLLDGVGHIGLIASFAIPARSFSTALDDMVGYLDEVPGENRCATG